MRNIAEVIKAQRKLKDWSQTELAQKAGMSKQSISMYESGSRTPSYTALETLANVFNISISEFLTPEERSQGLRKAQEERDRLPEGILSVGELKPHYVPVVGSVAAGKPLYAEQNFDCVVDAPRKADYALKIEGDSMAPNILNGDTVFIQQMDDVDDGQIAVVLLDDSATLKHVFHMPDGLMLMSDNPNYSPMYVKFADYDYVRILGRLCGFVRMFY